MQEVFEKIIEKLEEKTEQTKRFPYVCPREYRKGIKKAIEVVEQVAEEYNNGWISVEQDMPKEHDSIFAKLKDTDKWREAMFEKSSDVVSVTIVDKYGKSATSTAHTIDGKWSCDLLKINSSYKITHWQPLPEPYQPKGDKE